MKAIFLLRALLSSALVVVPNAYAEGILDTAEQFDIAPNSADEAGSDALIDEVIVTAQKREERLQNVPISMSVLSGEVLDKSTMATVTDELNQVPGVVASVPIQGNGAHIQMRGVGASGAIFNGSSPIAYYLDSVPFGFVQHAVAPQPDPYDLQRIEVLRGPQGTLYGAGGQGGVVRVLTNDAALTEFQMKTRLSTSNTEDGAWNYGADAAINAPIVEGRLAVRGVLGYKNFSGWIDGPTRNNVNESEHRNYRVKINAQPTERLSIGLSGWSVRDNDDAQSAGTDDGRTVATTREPHDIDHDAYGLKISYDFSDFSVLSMTSYLDYETLYWQDIARFGLPGFKVFVDIGSEIFSQEVVLNSTHSGSWRWTAGAFYRDAEEGRFQIIPPGGFLYVDEALASESAAVFGEVTRSLLDGTLELTVGTRYFRDDVSVDEKSVFLPSAGAPVSVGIPLYSAEDTFSKSTYRGVLTWHPHAYITVYGSFSEGFRSGQPQNSQTQASFQGQFPSAEPDTLKNYEIGAKGSLWGRRLVFDAAIYFTDWRDVQQALGLPFMLGGNTVCCAIAQVNSESASGLGFDVGVTIRPVEGLELGGTFSWNDLTLDEAILSGGNLIFAKGERLNYSSKYTAGASASYAFPLGKGKLVGRLAVSANYSSKQINRLGANPVTVLEGDDFLLARTSFAIEEGERWSAAIYADNITDESWAVPGNAPPPDLTPRIRPRTVGVQVDYRY